MTINFNPNEEGKIKIQLPLTHKIIKELYTKLLKTLPKDKKEFRDSIEFVKVPNIKIDVDDQKQIERWKGLTLNDVEEKKIGKALESSKKKDETPFRNINRYVDEKNKIIVEQVYHPEEGSMFCIYDDKTGEIKYNKKWEHGGMLFYPNEGEEIEKGAVKLPSKALEYEDEELDKEIENFIHEWLDVPENVVRFGIWNTKRSWVYDKFHTLNYLRALGDTGVGKSRYLNTFGHIHYTPIFTSGTTTPAPLFRILDKWRGTLVMDEADLKKSDESEDVIKIMNQGFEKGSFIMRCDQNDAKKISFFEPYGPKILGTRRTFSDKATESRCITHVMSVTERKDIKVNLNKNFYKQSESIRNKLLMWRFKNFFKIDLEKKYDLGDLEPRVRQIVSSYIALFGNNENQMESFKEYIKTYQEDLIEERQTSFEGSIVGILYSLLKIGQKNITANLIIRKGDFTAKNGKPMQPRALNSYLKSLGFKKSEVKKVDGTSQRCIPIDEKHINKLFTRYGYEVTEVTVVTGTNKIYNNKDKSVFETKNTEIQKNEVANRMHCNNRNSVTEKEEKEPINFPAKCESCNKNTTNKIKDSYVCPNCAKDIPEVLK